jgi:cardiolipin synthase
LCAVAGALLWLAAAFLSGCTKVPPPTTAPHISIMDPVFQQSLEASTGAPIIGDNKVEILLNGEETFPALVQALRSAQETVTFEAYIFRKSTVAEQIVEALTERCRAGVRVAILLDAHGSSNVPKDYVKALKNAGCQIVPDFRPMRAWQPRRSNMRNHRRIVVVDGRVGFTGGYGLDEQWMGNGKIKDKWRETNVRIEGPAVQQLQSAFMEHWREATGAGLGGHDFYPYPPLTLTDAPVRTQVVTSSPKYDDFSLYTVFLQAISAAQRSILISTPYLFPGEQITAALVNAVRRGVKVIILVPAITTQKWIEYLVQESHREDFGPLLDGGIKLYEYNPGLLHTKTMVIDGIWSTLGSMNLDNRSMGLNDELNLVLYSETIAKRLEHTFFEDLSHSHEISREQLRSRGWFGRFLGFVTGPMQNQF